MTEKIIERDLNEIITESFRDYAREVVENRALPDARDGLKPVQRRILYAMRELGLSHDKPFRKCARIVGDVLGKYHPHGDASVYNALVNLAQPFNRRYILVEGQGNFGTLDDPAAAMRYTEARLSALAEEMLRDLEKDMVTWQNNFDDTTKEPKVLPALIPNLLVNGSSGIAVGLACNIPPHNLGEVIDGICAYIENPEVSVEELLRLIKGPDFPSGGIVSPVGLKEAYESGVGSIAIRSRVAIEGLPDARQQVVISEIPYQVSKQSLIEKMARYIEGRAAQDVEEIRDESDQNGIRIVIEMKRGGNPEGLLKELFEKTELQTSFGCNFVALVSGKPATMSLRDMIAEFVAHRKDVVERRVRYDLSKAELRIHIIEGLIRAVEQIDAIVACIKGSADPKDAKENLMTKFAFSETQAQAILDIRLQRLTKLERQTLLKEKKELEASVARFRDILSSDRSVLLEVKRELEDIRAKYSDPRRTLIADFVDIRAQAKVEAFTLQINTNGKVRRLSESYSGDKGLTLKTDSTKIIWMFDSEGAIVKFGGSDIPQSLDRNVVNMCNMDDYSPETPIIFVTSDGQVKKSSFQDYSDVKHEAQAIKLSKGAKVIRVVFGALDRDLTLLTRSGYAIRFSCEDLRPVGRVAAGVRGIKLSPGDCVVACLLPNESVKITTALNQAFDLTPNDLAVQNRGGRGQRVFKAEVISVERG